MCRSFGPVIRVCDPDRRSGRIVAYWRSGRSPRERTMPLARFDARAQPLKDLLNATGTGFYVPLYQRPYRWTKRQRLTLNRRHRRRDREVPTDCRSSTFLGSLITVDDSRDLVPTPTDRPGTVRQVIDGQQRIATLLGLCGELRRAIGSALGISPGMSTQFWNGSSSGKRMNSRCRCRSRLLNRRLDSAPHDPGGEDRWGEPTSNTPLRLGCTYPPTPQTNKLSRPAHACSTTSSTRCGAPLPRRSCSMVASAPSTQTSGRRCSPRSNLATSLPPTRPKGCCCYSPFLPSQWATSR